MDADREHPTRRGTARAFIAAAAVALVMGAPATIRAAGTGNAPERGDDKTASMPAAKAAADGHGWYDNGVWRSLAVDATLRAEPGAATGKSLVLRRVSGPVKAAEPGEVVLRDDAGRARALPGGVLLVAPPGDEAATRALLARHGLTGARRIAGALWRVDAAPGLASLALANRLATSGEFVSAQPDWWLERVTK